MPHPWQGRIAILLSGAPGMGKSTIQRLAPSFFRSRLGETAAFGTDEIYMFVDPDWSEQSERLRCVCKDICIQLALNLFRHGIQIVLIAGNALYDKRDVDDYVSALSPVSSVYHFTLDAQLEVVVQRVQRRGDSEARSTEWLAEWLEHIRQHTSPWTRIIDVTQLTPSETLEQITVALRRS